jgi:hypothetical protein
VGGERRISDLDDFSSDAGRLEREKYLTEDQKLYISKMFCSDIVRIKCSIIDDTVALKSLLSLLIRSSQIHISS